MPELPDELREPFEAGRLTLYKSTLRPQGAEYEPLKRVELSAGESSIFGFPALIYVRSPL